MSKSDQRSVSNHFGFGFPEGSGSTDPLAEGDEF